jgi:hypothetical protein
VEDENLKSERRQPHEVMETRQVQEFALAAGPALRMDRARIGGVSPVAARVIMILIVSTVAITGIVVVNSRYHGSFLIGVVIILIPFLVLSYCLPYLLPVRCPRCGGRMRFRFVRKPLSEPQCYAYVCERCEARHEWEGASSSATLDP